VDSASDSEKEMTDRFEAIDRKSSPGKARLEQELWHSRNLY
jgi:hypothetical protein